MMRGLLVLGLDPRTNQGVVDWSIAASKVENRLFLSSRLGFGQSDQCPVKEAWVGAVLKEIDESANVGRLHVALIEGLLGVVEEFVAFLAQIVSERNTRNQDVCSGVLPGLYWLMSSCITNRTMVAECAEKWHFCHFLLNSFHNRQVYKHSKFS